MNNVSKIVLAGAIVVAIGGGFWFFTKNSSEDSGVTRESSGIERKTSDSDSGFGSIDSIVARGKSLRCEIGLEEGQEDDNLGGVVYVDGKNERFRMDISTGDNSDIGMITDTDFMYQWYEGANGKEGTKMSKATMEEMENMGGNSFNAPSAESPDGGIEYSYKCSTWKVDVSKFTPPSDVQFTDMDEMFNQMMQDIPEGF